MRHCLTVILLFLTCFSFSQNSQVDRSNYQLLWKVSHINKSQTAYLFGSYHSNDNDVFEFPDELYSALYNSEAIILETDISDLMTEEQLTIPQYSSSKEKLLDWFLPVREPDRITYTPFGSDDGRPQFMDMYFKQIADNCEKTFYPLETLEEQLSIGENNLLDPEASANVELLSTHQLKQKYLEGNAKDIHKYTRNSTLSYVNLYEDLIVNRNIKMAIGIDTLIQKHESSFIAVGASHLLGEKGIVPLLREKGYTVELAPIEFSEKETQMEKSLKSCNGYTYRDERYDISVHFGGKPNVKEIGNGDRLIKYLELGQGNSYSISIFNYSLDFDLKKLIKNNIYNSDLKISKLDSLFLPDGTKAYQGVVTHSNYDKEWVRIFRKDNFQYVMTAKGGFRFMNSKRFLKFFDSFKFQNKTSETAFTESISSRTGTLKLKMPPETFQENRGFQYDKVWEAKWFNPKENEILYVYESIKTDNTIAYTNDFFGDFITKDFHKDSISFSDIKHVKGSHVLKSFEAIAQGKKIYGLIRMAGNLIQLIEYSGNDLQRKEEFFEDFKTFHDFPKTEANLFYKTEDFSVSLSDTSIKIKDFENAESAFRDHKEYIVTDEKSAIAYQIYVNKFKSWAFSQKEAKQLLIDQLIWPPSEHQVEIDTVFHLDGEIPTMDFRFYYPSSENIFEGKTFINGKTIINANKTYPKIAEEQLKNIGFLESLVLPEVDENTSDYQLPLLKNQIMINNIEAVEDLILNQHVSDSLLEEMLLWPNHFWNSFDKNGLLQASIIYTMDWQELDLDLMEVWQNKINEDNFFITIASLMELQENDAAEQYISMAEKAKRSYGKEIDFYRVLTISEPSTDFLKKVWSFYEPIIKDSITWEFSFKIPRLLEDSFFESFFTSEEYVSSVMAKDQAEWIQFRYLEIMYEHHMEDRFISMALEKWEENETDLSTGSVAAWRTIIDEKVKRKTKRAIKNESALAIAYSKVMAISETPVYDLLSFEEMIGYIGFDHYHDAYQDKSKELKHIENRTLYFENEAIQFAFYIVKENDKIYYMTRHLPYNRKLPSYGGFGANTHFFYRSESYKPEEIEKELKMKIQEERREE